ncbi:hypothetical protein RR46_15000 [Papilio xuthus]|uniref:Uncharacterized protein n=1 Tax=Papilio xuthus TaxID=66420 RepID=A0A194PDR9_PAPXU|nr:hypothetical protein RR46_15000 [Papilio xuthus]
METVGNGKFHQPGPLGKAAAAFRQQTAGVSRHVLPEATRSVSRSLPRQYTPHPRSSGTTNRTDPLGFPP